MSAMVAASVSEWAGLTEWGVRSLTLAATRKGRA